MKGQYQSMYNLPPTNSYSINFPSETKIYDKNDVNSYNTNLFSSKDEVKDSSLKPSFTTSFTFNPTENKDYFINIFEDSKKSDLHEDLLSPFSSLPSSSNSSTTSLSLPSPSTYSTQSPLSNDLYLFINPYRYEPLSMKIPEIKKEFTTSKPNTNYTNFFPKFNIFLRPFTFYSSGKIDRIWRYLTIWSILLTLLCYSDPFEAKYIDTFITPIKYFVICLAVISLIFRIIIMFAQNNTFKSYIKSYTTSTTNENNNTSPPTYTETQQQQKDATVINMEQNNQFTPNTRETQNENSAGFVKPSLCGGCCDQCYCYCCCNGKECCNPGDANCRNCVNYCIAGCLNIFCCYSVAASSN